MIEEKYVDIRNKEERKDFIENLETKGYIIDKTFFNKNDIIGGIFPLVIDLTNKKINPGMIPSTHNNTSKTVEPTPTLTGICLLITLTSLPSSLTGPVTSSNWFAIFIFSFFSYICNSYLLVLPELLFTELELLTELEFKLPKLFFIFEFLKALSLVKPEFFITAPAINPTKKPLSNV